MAIKENETSESDELAFSNEARLDYEDQALEEEEKEFENEANSSDSEEGEEKDELPAKKEDSSKEGEEKKEEDWEGRYKETQGEYTKTQQLNKEQEAKIGDLDKRLERLGGLDNVEKYLDYLQKDPDFVKLLNQKRDSKNFGISEEGLTPEAKEVLELVKKIAKSEVDFRLSGVKQDFDGKIDPYIEAAQDRVLGEIYDRMDTNYGESWSEELETIQELSKDWSEDRVAKLKYSDVEELYIIALKRNGKFDKFAEKVYSDKINKTKEKSTSLSRTGSVKRPPKGKVRNMFDAAKRAELKAQRG